MIFTTMRLVILYCYVFISAASANTLFGGPTYESVSPCSITGRDVEEAIRVSDRYRAVCEYSSFKSGDCSNYWAAKEEAFDLASRFQRCVENQVNAFRNWAAGPKGAFVAQGNLDRAAVQTATNNVQQTITLASLNVNKTQVDEYTLSLSSLQDGISKNYALTKGDITANIAQTNALNNASEGTTRSYVDTENNSTRANDVNAETQNRNTFTAYSTAVDSDITSDGLLDRSNTFSEATVTRADVDAQENALRNTDSVEETSTRTLVDGDSQQIQQAAVQSIADTNNLITVTDAQQEQAVRSTVLAAHVSVRVESDQQTNLTNAEVDYQQQLTRTTLAAAHAASTAQTAAAETAAAQSERDLLSASTSIVSANIANGTATEVSASSAAASSVVSNSNSNLAFLLPVPVNEDAATQNLAQQLVNSINANTPQLVQNVLQEYQLINLFFAHFHLARNDTCSGGSNGKMNWYQSPNIAQADALCVDAINYYTIKYGAAKIGSASSYLTQARNLAPTDLRTAMVYYRMAYNAVTQYYSS